jgi:hypothetical protein
MDHAERTGLAIAAVGHVILFGVLSLGLFTKPAPKPPLNDVMDVAFVDAVSLRSAAPAASEPPARSEAPERGTPDAPPPEAAPRAAREAAPAPKPPEPRPSVAKPAPEKPTPAKSRLSRDMLKGLRDPAEPKARAAGSRLGPDFLESITAADKGGKGTAPRAATVDARAMAGLAGAIAAQVKPCYVVPAGGTDSSNIVTVLRLQFKPDGSVAGKPSVVEQSGVTAANQSYSRQMAEAAKRAVLKCAPLRLPPDLYRGGWEDIEFGFNPRQMG